MSLVVSYGGGTNSAAMLVGLLQHGERPDAIVFADTGGEKPRTYGHLLVMQRWCELSGFPSIMVVRGDQPQQVRDGSLMAECVRLGTIPSRAMGFGSCSDKWKVNPVEKWLAAHDLSTAEIAIGYHAGEVERANRRRRFEKPCRYPLIEYGWDYDDCRSILTGEGLPDPGKSACDFCPSSKSAEVLRLRILRPRRMASILEMERRALAGEGQAPPLHSCKGLGRRFSWTQLLREHDSQPGLFKQTPEECGEGCFT